MNYLKLILISFTFLLTACGDDENGDIKMSESPEVVAVAFFDALYNEKNVKKAAKELQVFLSYLCTRVDIEPFVQEFNKQSRTSEILLGGGHAKIKFKDQL